MPGGSTDGSPFNQSFYIEHMNQSRIIPVISKEALLNLVLGGYRPLVAGYADHSKYPLEDRDDLHKIAKFRSLHRPDDVDRRPWVPVQTGGDYLSYVKEYLLKIAVEDGVHHETLRIAKHEQKRLSASDLADRLGYPVFDDEKRTPLEILADLPLPIVMTTSCHTFIEVALKKVGKEPRSEFCRWYSGLHSSRSVFDDDYEPSEQEPLVYHLHGIDTEKGSLVLAEDDYLDYLVKITRDEGNDRDRIPDQIRQAMSQSALVLLGFELHSWAFRVFLWGLIKGLKRHRKGLITLQVPTDEVEQAFLRRYFDHEAALDIYWGSVLECVEELQEQWGAST